MLLISLSFMLDSLLSSCLICWHNAVRRELLSIFLCVSQMEQVSGQLEALQQEHHRLTATCQDQEQQNRLLQNDCAQLQVKPKFLTCYNLVIPCLAVVSRDCAMNQTQFWSPPAASIDLIVLAHVLLTRQTQAHVVHIGVQQYSSSDIMPW